VSELTRQQFASAVSATLSSVHHLYREIHRLISGLKEQLGETPDPLTLFGGTVARSGRDQGRLVVRNEYALLFKPSGDEEEEDPDDEDEEADDGDEIESPSPRRRRAPATVVTSDVFLGVVLSIYDPRGPESFEPVLSYGVMSSWSVGGKALAPTSSLILARYMLRRIPRAIVQPGLRPGDRVQTTATVKSAEGLKKVADRRLSCKLPLGVKAIPLVEMEDAASLQAAVDTMKEMYRSLRKE
jgi:hypothetical protein